VVLRQRSVGVAARVVGWLPVPLLYAIGALAYVKVSHPPPELEARLLAVFAGLLLAVGVGAGHAWLRRVAPLRGALALDHHHGLDGRVTNAIAFGAVPAAARTPFMEAAIRDALATTPRLAPGRAAPLRVPRDLLLVVGLLAGLAALAVLEVPVVRQVPPPPTLRPLVMSPDDIDLFRELAEQLAEKSHDPESLAAARRFNQLIEDLAERRLDRREAFQRLDELERDLLRGAEAEKEALEEGLSSLARELQQSDLTRSVARAFEEKRLADAEQALRELAARLRDAKRPPSKADLERLREALRRASESSAAREERLAEERRRVAQEREQLLKKRQEGKATARDQQQLAEQERKLERLDRESKRARDARRELTQLDRDLAEAARQLMEAAGDRGAEDLESAAEDVNRMAQKEMSRAEKEDLLRRLREMREVLRQQGKGGEQQMERMRRFSERARGQQGAGQRGSGQGQAGSGEGAARRLALRPGPGGIPVPAQGAGQEAGPGGQRGLLGKGQGQGAGAGDPAGSGDSRSGGDAQGGAQRGGLEAGHGHDPNLAGEASEAHGELADVSAVAADTGEGTASSQVILGAAERGFVGRGYREVFTQYQTVAEEEMQADEIPPGYRFYVQRYFQLIRPRE
jgi:hypothetical protein